MTIDYLGEYYQDAERMKSLQQELLITDVTQKMWQAMREKHVSRAELAKKLGLTKGRISQILNGRSNLTLRTTADIFTALNERLTTQRRELFVLDNSATCNAIHGTFRNWMATAQGGLWDDVSALTGDTKQHFFESNCSELLVA
jgi:transcriptional regulator with XRE-family HTH domain